MTARESKFCDEYLIDSNPRQAAFRARYKMSTANTASEWLNPNSKKYKPEVRARIDSLLEQMHTERVADAQEVLEYLTSVMRGEHTEQVLRLAGGGVQEIINIGVSESDRLTAAKLLGKRYGIFTDSISVELEPVTIVNDLEA